MHIQTVVLAAGRGTRLGQPGPKTLTVLGDGRTILQQQIDNLTTVFGQDVSLALVVGFEFQKIIEHSPSADFVLNHEFRTTNTSKSLLRAFKASTPGGVLWMNGDIVFEPGLVRKLEPYIRDDQSFIAVNRADTGVEEMKYLVDAEGFISEVSKDLVSGQGEAIGINYISSADKQHLIEKLEDVRDDEYFESAICSTIKFGLVKYRPVDISDFYAVEIDFPADLVLANELLLAKRVSPESDLP